MNTSITVRPEAPEDAAAIEALTVQAFLSAPHASHTEQHIVTALRSARALEVSLVAEARAVIVGHVAISPVAVSDDAPGWFGLGPLSVLPAHQGRGIGTRLAHDALEVLRRRGASGCVLLGEPDYYGRFGFRADPALVLPGAPAGYFQAIRFTGAAPRGVVRYHAAFDAAQAAG